MSNGMITIVLIAVRNGQLMIKLPYEQMKFHYVTNFYDYPLSGSCIYNNRIALFTANDETDYQTMNDTCPCCKLNGSDDYKECHCQNAPDLFYYITTLSLGKRIYHRLKPYYFLLWYIKNYGIKGMSYWNHWFRGRS